MEYSAWSVESKEEKQRLLQSWIRELIDINKNIANPPSELYNKLRRRKILKNHLQDVSRYMRYGFDPNAKKDEENIRNPKRD